MNTTDNINPNLTNNLDSIDEDINLTDIFTLEFLQKFQDAFSNALGVASLTTDKNGVPITNGSNFTDFCMKISRQSKEGLKRCTESDAHGGSESARTGKPAVYYCGSGLMDFGAPIIIKGKQIGSIIGGQVLPSEPDKDKFIQLAHELNADPDEVIAAIEKVKIVPEEQLQAAADLLYVVTSEISKMGYQQLILKKVVHNLHDSLTDMMATIEELTATASNITEYQIGLNSEIQNVSQTINQINTLSESIENISGKSRLLGLNASIEAARAGEAGRSFSVVANEIQKMANSSKSAVENIKQFTSHISDSVTNTMTKSDSTLEMTKQQEAVTKSIVSHIDDLVSMTELISKLASESV